MATPEGVATPEEMVAMEVVATMAEMVAPMADLVATMDMPNSMPTTEM